MSKIIKNTIHMHEVADGERFAFGENWVQFLKVVDNERIQEAIESLKIMLEVDDLNGKKFLDIGSGSGLFSLAAKILGAEVLSFDYDPQSVECTRELKKRYFNDDNSWVVEAGSVLDKVYLKNLGRFDIVYSWGVLHHTGEMWAALNNIENLVAENGKLFLALYNDQGNTSKIWHIIKRTYCLLPSYFRWTILIPCYLRLWGATTIKDIILFRPFHSWRSYKKLRGMSPHRDVLDWVGGYPFEVASPEQIFNHYKKFDFHLTKLKTCSGGLGCNEFVFQRYN